MMAKLCRLIFGGTLANSSISLKDVDLVLIRDSWHKKALLHQLLHVAEVPSNGCSGMSVVSVTVNQLSVAPINRELQHRRF